MSNFKVVFLGTYSSETALHELECFVNDQDEIFISITMDNNYSSFICLNKSTAIKFAKTLRTEINKIQNEDV